MKIGYARVSSQDQNTGLQIDALERDGCERIYEEKVPGAGIARPELDICLQMLRAGDVLVVWKLDRLGRSLKDLVGIVADLEHRNIAFRSISENIDTGSAGGKLVFHLFGALAEFERSLIRERTMAGLAAARARGRKGGRTPKMDASDAKKAAAMLTDPEITKTNVAAHFNVTRATLDAALKRHGFPMNPAIVNRLEN
jgi:DNA invertase Pin-like site-specific DNA recombinase